MVHTLAVSEAGHADLQRYAPSTGDGSDSLLDQVLDAYFPAVSRPKS